jgi:hypothetical protein
MNRAHVKIIDLWDSPERLAEDLCLKPDRVRKWRQRQIPSDHWPAIIEAAKRRDITITPEMFFGTQPVPQSTKQISQAAA